MLRPDLEICRIHPGQRLRDAMLSLHRSGKEICVVVDDQGRLVGTMTDGDIRRALLDGAALDSPLTPFMQRRFTAVTPRATRSEVLDLMQARTYSGIPIVDGDGVLVGLHLLHEILGAVERPNWAVIMAGGKGTRLWPLTQNIPKPMIKVAGRPILERIVLHLLSYGIRRVFLSINYLGHVIEEHFGDGSRFGCRIEYLREEKPLGTGGALAQLPERAAEPLLVMNGDLVTQADLGAMLDLHGRERHQATLGIRRYFHTVPFGCVEVQDGQVARMEEKPQLSMLINAGIYVFQPEVVQRVPRGCEFALPSLVEGCLERREPVGTFEIEEDWIDVGQRDQLRQAQGLE